MNEQLHPGDIVTYTLLPKDQPTDPEKQWKGQVKRIVSEYILVESLEDGYRGETEHITFDQIKSIQQVTGYPS